MTEEKEIILSTVWQVNICYVMCEQIFKTLLY